MLLDSFPSVPDHIVDLFARTASVSVDLTTAHAPHRLIEFLYGDPSYHLPILQLNNKSALSVRVGDIVHLYDKRVVKEMNE